MKTKNHIKLLPFYIEQALEYLATELQACSKVVIHNYVRNFFENQPMILNVVLLALILEFSGGCVAMSSGNSLGKWETKDCKTTKAFSVCKKYIGKPKEPEVLPKPTDPCPPGWHNGSGLACYKVKCYSCLMLIAHDCLGGSE